MKKLIAISLVIFMLFSFTACGEDQEPGEKTEKPGSSQTDGNKDNEDNKGGYTGNYTFNPPKDNYRLVYNGGTVDEVRVGDMYSYFENNTDGYSVHINFKREGKVYVPYQGKWYNDTNMTYSDYADLEDSYPPIFGSMEEGLLMYLRAFGTEEDQIGEKLKDYYVGEETVCGVKCWVFDSKGINALYAKYWIDPSNGVAIKVEHYRSEYSNYVEELTTYDINYTKMDQKYYPADYENVDVL